MPAVKVFWYDAMREDQPNFPGAPQGEILGDLPRWKTSNAHSVLKPGEHQIIGGVFTDEFFSATEPPPQPARPETASPDMTAHEREDAKWMHLMNTGTNGSLFKGDKGMITTGTYGEWTRLLPVEQMRDYDFPPEFIPRSPGHYRDWIRAAKGGSPACSNFNVSAPFTEWIALGAIATRLNCRLEWDGDKMKITNSSQANDLLKPNARKGWKIG